VKKSIYVKITSVTLPSWYEKRIGEVYRVKEKPTKYCGGLGYVCLDFCGGILVSDCEIVEAPK
jgi:hypothetical protein